MTSAFSWITADETAEQALVRIFKERPFLILPPPFHRLPLRAGNVVEIVGPSPSAKTLILIQAAINCILPKEWKGVSYGGLERAVLFVDLDCRFDVLSIARALQRRIIDANGLRRSSLKGNGNEYDKELFAASMRRFLYMRCYNSFEFLATLKTLHHRIQQEKEKGGSAVYMLLIDSIGAFYWMDRALPTLSTGNNKNRKSLSLQTVVETVVQEIQRLLVVHPMLVLATKSAAFGDKQSITEVIRKRPNEKTPDPRCAQNKPHRCFMPSVWQSFVSHRMLLRALDCESKHQNRPTFSTEWLLPSLNCSDHFTVNDGCLLIPK
ncbi:DNA repair protein XRCC2 homolog isoform X1 [Salvia splendens]|uniref:DNA repair protein XRCC2 homolog isoform X1 n=1 Tax=Salvia splendens TaxID=180675 RepID=UPI001C267DFE|nr:DNA repair protein XRCC2 homolog isoform X1 [Salvia splendens]